MQKFPLQGYPTGADESAPGSIVDATNMIMSRPGVATRRGPYTKFLSNLPNKPTLGVGQRGDGSLASVWTDGGTITAGDIYHSVALGPLAAVRPGSKYLFGTDDLMNSVEFANSAGLLFPTSPALGIDTDSQNIWFAGVPRSASICLNSEVDVVNNQITGAVVNPSVGLNPGDVAAYRAVLAYDRRKTQYGASSDPVTVSGPPSGRYLYARQTSATAVPKVPKLRVYLPADFIYHYSYYSLSPFTAYLYIYRSILTAAAAGALPNSVDPAPTDEMQLVFKTIISVGDTANGYIEFTDICPSGGEGPALYCNPSLGGSNQERWLPPQANSIATYKGTTFYGGIQERVARTYMLVTGAPYVWSGTFTVAASVFTFTIPSGSINPVPYMPIGSVFSIKNAALNSDYVLSGPATLSGTTLSVPVTAGPANGTYSACHATCGSVVIQVDSNTWTVNASLNVATTGASGKFLVEYPVNSSTALLEVPTKVYVQGFAANLCTGINLTCTAANLNVTASNLATGTLDTATITLEMRSSLASTGVALSTTVTVSGTTTNVYDLAARVYPVKPAELVTYANRLMWGPNGIPDCVCPVNQIDIGSPEKEILKLVVTRNALYIFKEDGLWYLDGDGTSWVLTLISPDAVALAPSSIDTYQDVVYAACTEGVLMVSGGSVSSISGAIQTEYRDILLSQAPAGANLGVIHTCIASHIDSSLTITIPGANSGNLPFGQRLSAIFVFSFITRQWLKTVVAQAALYPGGDPNVGTQESSKILCRMPFRAQTSNPVSGATDTTNAQIIRLLDQLAYPYLGCHAIETGGVITSGTPPLICDAMGRVLPFTDDSQQVTLTRVNGTTYTFSGPLAVPESVVAGGWIYVTSPSPQAYPIVSVSFSSDSTPEILVTITVAAGTTNLAGSQWMFFPPPASITFTPFGDGVQAYNFNEVMIKQTRRSSAKNIQFTFWLDNTTPFPYTAPDTQVLGPTQTQTISAQVTRAGVPARMTRGSTLNVRIDAGFSAGERIEFSTLLADFTPTAAEEVI